MRGRRACGAAQAGGDGGLGIGPTVPSASSLFWSPFDRDVRGQIARSQGVSDFNSEADCRMRLKNAAFFAVGVLSVSYWPHGSARCQSSLAAPLSLAPPPSVTDQRSSPAATCHWGGLNMWCSNPEGPGVLSPRPTAKASPPPAAQNVSPPMATDDVPPHTATAKASPPRAVKNVSPPTATDDVPLRTATAKASPPRAAKNISPPMTTDDLPPHTATAKASPPRAAKNISPPTATDDVPSHTATAKGSSPRAAKTISPPMATDDVPPRTATAKGSVRSATAKPTPGIDNILPTPRIGKRSPSQEPAGNYDGFTAGVEDSEETGQPLPIKPRPVKQSRVRQKADTTEGSSAKQPLDDQAEIEKLKPYLTICRGC